MAELKLTTVQQQKLVGEGLAVGAIAAGIDEFAAGSIDMAFARAWRRWHWSKHLLQVRATVQRNDIKLILHRSSRRVGTVAYWSEDRSFTPHRKQTWPIEEHLESLAEQTDQVIPGHAWIALAEAIAGP